MKRIMYEGMTKQRKSCFYKCYKHTHSDNMATHAISENARGRLDKSSVGRHGYKHGQREVSHVLGVTGLVDFTMMQPAPAWCAVWIIYF